MMPKALEVHGDIMLSAFRSSEPPFQIRFLQFRTEGLWAQHV